MKMYQKILYYSRLFLFIISLILIFITIKNYVKIGLWGYIFFIIELIYILGMLITILSKREIYKNDLCFNIMHIGTYLYQIILSVRMFTFPLSLLVKESYIFYRNNYIILSVLLLTLIFYSLVLYGDLTINKKRKSSFCELVNKK